MQVAFVFTVRRRSSQIVGLAVLLTVALQVSNFRFQGSPYGEGRVEPCMIGPREIPSHASHPIAHSLLNQKLTSSIRPYARCQNSLREIDLLVSPELD